MEKNIEAVMDRGTMQYRVLVILFAVVLLVSCVLPVYASDELFLSGFVKRVDHEKKIVVVDVTSQACHGLRQFTVDDPAKLDDAVGKRIDFPIDSSICKGDNVYKMFPGERN